MEIVFKCNEMPVPEEVVGLYERAGMPRPTNDRNRIAAMFNNSNLIVTARHDNRLVGVCRCLTDWVWYCYLADLAVDPECSGIGIGRTLVEKVKEIVGKQSTIVLLSVPSAVDYYPKLGFEKEERAFIQKRSK